MSELQSEEVQWKTIRITCTKVVSSGQSDYVLKVDKP